MIILKLGGLGLTGILISIIPLIILVIIILIRINQQQIYIYDLKIYDSVLFTKYIEKSKYKTIKIDAKNLTAKVSPLFPMKGRWILKISRGNDLILCQTNDFGWKYDDLKDIESRINSIY